MEKKTFCVNPRFVACVLTACNDGCGRNSSPVIRRSQEWVDREVARTAGRQLLWVVHTSGGTFGMTGYGINRK